ncbi:hypothetical protein, partial [Nitratifractor sp.]
YADLVYRENRILKRIQPQKRVDPYRKYFRSQAFRETQGSIRLKKLGLLDEEEKLSFLPNTLQ